MTPRAAKAKGRRHQQVVAKKLQELFKEYLEPEDVVSTPMGVAGPDIILSPRAQKILPFAIECKNVEKLSIWDAIKQANEYCKENHIPAVAFTRNAAKRYIAIDFEFFLMLLKEYYESQGYPIDRLPVDGGGLSKLVSAAKRSSEG